MLYKQYAAMERGDWEATSRQFYTGNASVARRHLLDAGGFDPAFRRAEDVELAYRLGAAGAPLHVRSSRHRHALRRTQLRGVARPRRTPYGRNDVIFGRDRGQAWLLDAISNRVPSAPPARAHADVVAGPAPTSGASDERRAFWRRPVGRPAPSALVRWADQCHAERGLQPDLLPRHGRRARLRSPSSWPGSTAPLRRERRYDHTSASRSSRRSGTSPTPPTCGHSSGPIPSIRRRLRADRRTRSTVGRPASRAIGNWTVRAGIRRTPGDPPAASPRTARRPVHPHPGPGDPRPRSAPAARRPSFRSMPRRSSTTSSAPTTATTSAAARVERLKWRLNRDCFARAAPSSRGRRGPKPGSSSATRSRPRRSSSSRLAWTTSAGPTVGDEAAVTTERRFACSSSAATWRARAGSSSSTPCASCVVTASPIELDLVTKSRAAAPEPGIAVHHGLGPEQPAAHRAVPPRRRLLPADARGLPADGAVRGRCRRAAAGLDATSARSARSSAMARPGCSCPSATSTALADALRRLAADPALRRRLGDEARASCAASSMLRPTPAGSSTCSCAVSEGRGP